MAHKEAKKVGMLEMTIVVAVIAFAAIYAVAFAIGPSHLGDDIAYAWLAHDAATGTFVQNAGNVLSIRVLHIFPIAFFYWAFGSGVYPSAAYDIISFVLTVFLTYLIGKELYDWKVGALAAFLIAVFPMVAIHAVTMSDNIPLMLFATLAIFSFIKGLKENSKWWYFLSGVATCICGFIMPEGFIFWIAMGILFLWRLWKGGLKIKNEALYIVWGFLLILLIMIIFNTINTGQPLITFVANAEYYSQLSRPDIAPQPVVQSLQFYPQVIFPYKINSDVFSILTSAYQGYNKVGLFFYAFVAALAYLIFRKDKKMLIPLAWFAITLAYLEFGPMHVSLSPLSYVLSHRLDRYVTLIGPPLCIILSAAAIQIVESSKKHFKLIKAAVLTAGLIILVITSFEVTWLWHQGQVDTQYTEISIAGTLSHLPNTTKIYFDSGFGDIPMYMNFDNMSRFYTDYDGIQSCTNFTAGSYVVIPRELSDGFSFTPTPPQSCGWNLVSAPTVPYNGPYAEAPATAFIAALYYVPN